MGLPEELSQTLIEMMHVSSRIFREFSFLFLPACLPTGFICLVGIIVLSFIRSFVIGLVEQAFKHRKDPPPPPHSVSSDFWPFLS